ncbi:peroxiredoxin Q/BCP [Catalinimonas alkaloidigena]|uniref:thioredoxin-dependent peroxiredoxin n=1 Tax=Catalinimonas alkaloidigena TaxID=1075417 RepID=A0A1G9K5Y8_9BACT|nr:thioredoxin-dependent thiol peroxidase [Catalinimonas alkaloidigena]SDL44946.1 peroxiredoxin Q/BCP [Catalinimonas alkaloidigena]
MAQPTLAPGDPAPAFEGRDQNGHLIRLADYQGKKVVLYFYPKDDTPGCTAQACNLRDNRERLSAQGYEVIGVSVDDEKSHQKFIEKYDLNFPLVADTDHTIVEAYGVWQEKSMYGRKYMGIVRTTFLIDEQGTISEVISKVKTGDHTEQILAG